MEKAIHKNEFIRTVADRTGETQAVTSRVINETLKLIGESLRDGDKVVLTGFGTFEMRRRSRRQGINPQTREPITIDESATPGFTASATFKGLVNRAARKNGKSGKKG